jgi:hypothetical protein
MTFSTANSESVNLRASCAPVRASLERFRAVTGGVAAERSEKLEPAYVQGIRHG